MPPVRINTAPTVHRPYRRRGESREDADIRRSLERDEAARKIQQIVSDDLRNGIIAALVAGYEDLYEGLGSKIDLFARNIEKADWAAAHDLVAHRAQNAVLASYAQRVTAREGPASRANAAYRQRESRMANGALRRAIAHEDQIFVTSERLSFLNRKLFDAEAAHWYRLNFGAGVRGRSGQRATFDLTIGGRNVGQLGLNTGPSVHPVILPPGNFIGFPPSVARRGLDPFYPQRRFEEVVVMGRTSVTETGQRELIEAGSSRPGRRTQARITKGIEARNYLDAGIRVIAEQLPRQYDEEIRDAFARAAKTVREELDQRIFSRPAIKVRVRSGVGAERRFARGAPL